MLNMHVQNVYCQEFQRLRSESCEEEVKAG